MLLIEIGIKRLDDLKDSALDVNRGSQMDLDVTLQAIQDSRQYVKNQYDRLVKENNRLA